jgi:hypothetical protein
LKPIVDKTKSCSTHKSTVCHESHTSLIQSWLPAAPTIATSLLAVYVVHKLTKFRDREKLLDDFHTKIEKAADDAAGSAFEAWNSKVGPERARLVAKTLTDIQRLGSLVNRLEIISDRWRIRWKLNNWPFVNVKISMGRELIDFRQELTVDPFNDPRRRANAQMAVSCEGAKSIFLLSMDLKFRNWFTPF